MIEALIAALAVIGAAAIAAIAANRTKAVSVPASKIDSKLKTLTLLPDSVGRRQLEIEIELDLVMGIRFRRRIWSRVDRMQKLNQVVLVADVFLLSAVVVFTPDEIEKFAEGRGLSTFMGLFGVLLILWTGLLVGTIFDVHHDSVDKALKSQMRRLESSLCSELPDASRFNRDGYFDQDRSLALTVFDLVVRSRERFADAVGRLFVDRTRARAAASEHQ